MIYPENIEAKIDFTVIREELGRRCASSLGRECVDAMHFETDYELVQHMLQLTDQMLHAQSDPMLTFPRGDIHDMREAIARIRIEGLFLDEAELDALRKTLAYAAELEHFFAGLDSAKYPLLKGLADERFSGLGEIVREIDRVLDRYGKLADHASSELARIRRELVNLQGSVGRTLASILRQAKADGLVDADAAPTLREGRLVIPVPPGYKRKIGGIVHDESATGKTVYIEPQQVVDANNHIRELEGAERRERIRILQAITDMLRPNTDRILGSQQLLAEVDFLNAKVSLAQTLHAIRPELLNEPMLEWSDARHPVLLLHYIPQGKVVVPLSIRLRAQENHVLVISGPNAGGKSVCLKTVALLQYMLQCGLLVPVAEQSRAGLFGSLMIDIGDEQSIQDELSTYSSHLRNMRAFVRESDECTLVLIDEMGTGTEPLIGGAIAEAILRELVNRRVFGIITTHYTNLKHFAEQTPGVVNGAMLYDRGAMRPLFQLSIGQAGSSFAIEIARQIGLSEPIIRYATDLVGEEHIDYDKQLQDIARDKRYWEKKREAIRKKEKVLEERIAQYEEQMSGIKAKKKEMLEEARQQAADLLQQSNATIERTIREIKEAKADKEKTKKARSKVESLKQKVEREKPQVEIPKTPKVMRDFSELKKLAKNGSAALNSQPSTVRNSSNIVHSRTVSFERTLDLRGYRADEALERLIAYMDDALMVGAGEVTILHGTGTGALKQLTRDYLNGLNRQRHKRGQVALDFGDGDVNHGGAGLTIVRL
ncbi:MAG: Smr/MutS family protein [Bacteroidales bacterium]|nr:Smr/MutS family protein [Bacteroidales bacterium]MDY6406127.1 Smr/MutS family protein [Bacteroidales bacterium]